MRDGFREIVAGDAPSTTSTGSPNAIERRGRMGEIYARKVTLEAPHMADRTTIEWTDATWNPVTGCTKIIRGCDNCYAARFSERFRGVPGHPFSTGFDLTLRPERLDQPLRWLRPRMVFVNSMSDLFHKKVPFAFVDRVFDTMEKAHWHIFQILTKRSSLMRDYLRRRYGDKRGPGHIWCGVSVEDAQAKGRIEHLRSARAGVRFLSVEPLIGAVGARRPLRRGLGYRGRRIRPRCTSATCGVGTRNPRSMSRSQCRILLQAMGRHPAEIGRASTRRPRMERISKL